MFGKCLLSLANLTNDSGSHRPSEHPQAFAIRQNLQSDLKGISGAFGVFGEFWLFAVSRFPVFFSAFLAVLGLWAI